MQGHGIGCSDDAMQDDIDRGMAAQLTRLRAAVAAGAVRVGWKIGINDPAMQRRLGLGAPVIGVLDPAGVLPDAGRYRAPAGALVMAEAELAIRIGDGDGGPAVAGTAPAIELVDYARPTGGLDTILAHAVFHAGVVFGPERAGPDPIAAGAGWPVLWCNDERAADPDPALDPGDLRAVLRHVATTLARYDERLRPGDRVICGSLVQPVRVRAGDRITADFGPLGAVRVTIAGAEHG